MAILQAFLTGGLICVIFLFVMKQFKIAPPILLTGGICFGCILAIIGLMGPIGSFGGAGAIIMVPGAGEAMYMGFRALLSGNAAPLTGFLTVLGLCVVLGIISGIIIHKRGKAR